LLWLTYWHCCFVCFLLLQTECFHHPRLRTSGLTDVITVSFGSLHFYRASRQRLISFKPVIVGDTIWRLRSFQIYNMPGNWEKKRKKEKWRLEPQETKWTKLVRIQTRDITEDDKHLHSWSNNLSSVCILIFSMRRDWSTNIHPCFLKDRGANLSLQFL